MGSPTLGWWSHTRSSPLTWTGMHKAQCPVVPSVAALARGWLESGRVGNAAGLESGHGGEALAGPQRASREPGRTLGEAAQASPAAQPSTGGCWPPGMCL